MTPLRSLPIGRLVDIAEVAAEIVAARDAGSDLYDVSDEVEKLRRLLNIERPIWH